MWLAAAAGLLSLALLGGAALALAGVGSASRAQHVVTAFVTGAALLSAAGMMAIALNARVSLIVFYVLLGALVIAAVRRHGLPSWPALRLRTDALSAALLLGAAALVLAIVLLAARDRLWWDGWAIWALKARVLFLEGTLPRAFFAATDGYGFAHLDYPLAVPLVDWWVYRHAGTAAPALASFVGAAWFATLPLLLWASLRAHAGERVAALAALGMAAFWPIAFYAMGGTADVVIAVSLLGAVIELERGIARDDRHALVRCGIFLTLGILAKNEGLALAAVVLLVGSGALLLRGERRLLHFLPLALPFVAFVPWWLTGSLLGVRESAVAWSQLAVVPERIPVFAARVGDLLASVPWLPVPLLALLGIVAAARVRGRGVTAAWLVLAVYFTIICAVYLLTPHDLAWLIDTSLPRVLGVFVPALVFISVHTVAASRQPAGRLA
jgi:hypothetical protein